MKTPGFFVGTLILLMLTGLSCNDPQSASATAAPNTLATFSIEGMVCEVGCAAVIRDEVAGLPGVSKAEVSFSDKKARILFDKEMVGPEEILEAISALGGQYKVTDLNTAPLQAPANNSGGKGQGSRKSGSGDQVNYRPIVFPDIFQNLKRIF